MMLSFVPAHALDEHVDAPAEPRREAHELAGAREAAHRGEDAGHAVGRVAHPGRAGLDAPGLALRPAGARGGAPPPPPRPRKAGGGGEPEEGLEPGSHADCNYWWKNGRKSMKL